jgi:hypothetical protein
MWQIYLMQGIKINLELIYSEVENGGHSHHSFFILYENPSKTWQETSQDFEPP